MIVGKGLLARAFEPYFGKDPHVIIFASGVSNSMETRPSEFEREQSLLRRLLQTDAKRFIYFGSCGVTASESELTPYMRHKQSMEALVRSAPGGLVLRLPQVVGKTVNPHTLTNFLRDRIVSGQHFTVWSRAERNLVDIDDIVTIGAKLAVEINDEFTMVSIAAAKSLLMPDIVKIFESALGKRGNFSVVEKGEPMCIDTTAIKGISSKLGINLGEGYIENVIRKYYGPDRRLNQDLPETQHSRVEHHYESR